LVLLLSSIALGNVALGLLMVFTFSLGLAGVLTGLGLSLVYAKHLFKKLPTPSRSMRALPALSALGITLIGCGISAKAFMQVIG
jgi:nickel/cobalt transporter (NicO) family protein